VFVDIFHDVKNNIMNVSERVDGKRNLIRHQPDFFFYYADPAGKHKAIDGTKCTRYETSNFSSYKEEIASMNNIGRKTYESDIKPLIKSLEQFYSGCKIPDLNVAFFDIEVDFDSTRGFSSPEEAFMPITAISVYQSWTDQLHTVVLKPKLLREQDAKEISSKFENTILCDSESQLLDMFLNLIDDADVFSGWNSGAFDIPYIVHRIQKIRGKPDTTRLSLWRQYPKQKEFDKYGETVISYEFTGRLHLDYLDLYRKYTYHELPSYRLDYVGQIEVDETKTQYSGTLDELYNNDFEKFIEYSRQDVALLQKIDAKNKFIYLVNLIAHENLVPIPTVMGAVALSDNAIILEAHRNNMVVPSRERLFDQDNENKAIAGAFVMDPVPGMYEWVASVDINSLYPSTFRALNMSPETIIGQVRQDITKSHAENKNKGKKTVTNADVWSGVFEVPEVTEIQRQSDIELLLELDSGDKQNLSAKQIWAKIKNNNWIISANGTIFRTDIEGIIPSLLTRWYAERKEYQKKLKEYEKEDLSNKTAEQIKYIKEQIVYWDKRQYVVKIMLNSVYGALTNAGSRFFDQRMGQSCTLTGRCITRHMMCKLNEILIGDYKFGDIVAYGDTDSAYITIKPIIEVLKQNGFEINKESFVDLANSLAEEVNMSFAPFLNEKFNVSIDRGTVIRCGREICATRAMFVKKKRYAALVYDKEGKRKDTKSAGEIKIMGMETERSDTPEWVQIKLEEMLTLVLEKCDEDNTIDFIKSMREEFQNLKAWEQGTPKRVNNLKHYQDVIIIKNGKDENGKTITVPGHVRASINWNRLREANHDVAAIKINDGSKVIVCKLKANSFGILSIAYPIDQINLPEWFTGLPFDTEAMVETIIDQKVSNIIGVLNWNLSKAKEGKVLESCFDWG